jgi:hypothetical protein
MRAILLCKHGAAKLFHEGRQAVLVSLLESGNVQTARDAITALAIYRDNERIRELIETAVSRRGDRQLADAVRREFDRG